jgi:hypothetical protein
MNLLLVHSLHQVVVPYLKHSCRTGDDEINMGVEICYFFSLDSGWEEDIDKYENDRWIRKVKSVTHGFKMLKGKPYA